MAQVNLFLKDGLVIGLRKPPTNTELEPLRDDEITVDLPITLSGEDHLTSNDYEVIGLYIKDKKFDLLGNISTKAVTDYDIQGMIENHESDLEEDINSEIESTYINAMTVPQLKQYKRKQVTVRFKHAMGWILNSYMPEEIDSWSEQKRDADKWGEHRAANPAMTDADLQSYNETPMLKELAKGKTGKDDLTLTVADVDEYQTSIISKSGFFRPYSGGLVGIKKRLLKAIDDQLDDFSGEVDPDAAEQAAKDALIALDTSEILAAGYAYIVANS